MLDIIIKNATILSMSGRGVGLIKEGAIGISGQEIKSIDDTVSLEKIHNAKRVIDAKGKIVMPGFVDAHCHSDYGIMCRGILTDLEFFLEQGLAGYQDTLDIEKQMTSCYAYLLEGIKHGVTSYGDMGAEHDRFAEIYEKVGVRGRLAEQMRELPWNMTDFLGGEYVFERKYAETSIKAMYRLLEDYGTDPNERVSAMVGFQALDYVSEDLVVELREIAKKYNAMIHTHMSQSTYECEQVESRYGVRPVDAFERLGILNENTLAAHMVYNRPDENKKAAKSGLKMAFCPCSWSEVGCTPPAAQYKYSDGIVGIGSDENAYTAVSPFFNMKSGHLSANVDAFNNNVPNVNMSEILRMHTIGSATALGIAGQVGSLEPGKKADVIIINPKQINTVPVLLEPLTNIPQNIVSTTDGNQVETVIVDGKIIMDERKVKTIDEQKIIDEVQTMAQEAAENAAEYYAQLPDSEVLNRQRWFEEK